MTTELKANDSFEPLGKALAAFIRKASGRAVTVRITKRYLGGFSWLTYGFTLTMAPQPGAAEVSRELILRLGHEQGLLSPYSAEPEYLVLSSLAESGVPVPQVLWYADDCSFLGAPFLVVEKAEGTVKLPFGRDAAHDAVSGRMIGEEFVEALATLHNFAWQHTAARNLRPLTTDEGAASVQIDRWDRMIQESGARPLPLLHRSIRWLKDHPPVAPRLCIVHGDYRAGNFLQDANRITAVLDWELVHLGDPHEDIAWACMKFLSGGSDLVCGLMPRAAFLTQYEKATGTAISPHSLKFYEVLSLVKICAMNLRAASRIENGTAPDLRMATFGFGLPGLQLEMSRIIGEAA